MRRSVLAVDGGNSKTRIVLVDEDGTVLATARAGPFLPQSHGPAAAVARVAHAVRLALGTRKPYADQLAAYVAGADLPAEEEALAQEFAERGLARAVTVGNDTLALLRAGTTDGWGVAVVCGAGVNCTGIGPDGGAARFPALGRLTGDWGGGLHLGEEILWHAARAEDGRGPATCLTKVVRDFFGTTSVIEASIGLHLGSLPVDRLHELTPALFGAAADGDAVASSLVERLAEEVALLGVVALDRLGLRSSPAEVILGGGVLTARHPDLIAAIEKRYAARAPRARVVVTDVPPIAGAALLGLDALGVSPTPFLREHLRRQLDRGDL